MPVRAHEQQAILHGRSLFRMQEQFDEMCERFEPADIKLVVTCNNCNAKTSEAQRRVMIHHEFRCIDCFRKLVIDPKSAIGISEGASDEEINELLTAVSACKDQPHLVTNFIANLFEPKKKVLPLLPSSPAPCN